MTSFRTIQRIAFAALILAAGFAPAAFAQVDMDAFKALKARSIGPAGMSGRVTAIDAVVADPDIVYVGTASGGLWKSTNGGIDFDPVFDDQPVHSIGSIAIYQKSPDIVYVGTGEGNPRNSMNAGNGVYKSLDGGRTWIHLGLDATRSIHRLFVHPDNPDIVYAGALGSGWGANEERGVYKTTDGGATWEQVLHFDATTGVGDMVMDPVNPNKLIAAMWQFHREPWFMNSGGENSGIYVTVDAGKTWTKRTEKDGLPGGILGRSGLAIAPSDPSVVYALVEATKNALYRSNDGGVTFAKVNDANVSDRPFYYNDLYVDPANENRLYHVASIIQVSDDGGRTFKEILGNVHPDHHAWWINPRDPHLIYEGNDGGMAVSRDRGATWRFIENLPLAQFYHIRVDNEIPYRICGGLQDNGSWCGPSQIWSAGGIRNTYWQEVAFGDGFDVMIHPEDPNVGYAMSQGGNVTRFQVDTGFQKFIKPIHPDGIELRFNWNAGIAQDPFDANTIYYGSQFVHQSTNRGDAWSIISPDLTTNDPEKQKQLESGGLTYDVTGAENFTTIIAIEPSPLERGVLWAGTDDGNVQITRDGGATWTNVVKNIRGLPAGTWVPQIRASRHHAGEAFVLFDDHRRNNWEPYAFHTTDYGKTWKRLTDAGEVWGYTLSIEQDPVAPNLLFLGTEFGLYVSFDYGDTWQAFKHGIPTASVMDLVIHPRDHDLVVATFGRAVFVIDDIRPLRAVAQKGAALLNSPLAVFEAPVAYQAVYKQAPGTRFVADAIYAGENRRPGAMISYLVTPAEVNVMPDEEKGEMDSTATSKKAKIEILDGDGTVIRTLSGPAEKGVNRVYWEMSRKGIRFNPFGENQNADEPAGADVLPGTYTARVSYAGQTDETPVEVRYDPRIDVRRADLEARLAMYDRWEQIAAVAVDAQKRLKQAGETIETVGKLLADRDDEASKTLKARGKVLADSIKTLTEAMSGKEVQGIRRDPETLMNQLFTARSYITSGLNAPDPSATIALDKARASLRGFADDVNAFFAGDWAAYRQAVDAANVSLFRDAEPLAVPVE
ncbi:MAG: hypothetical protein R2834_06190 [Rhodothermales bacterium]